MSEDVTFFTLKQSHVRKKPSGFHTTVAWHFAQHMVVGIPSILDSLRFSSDVIMRCFFLSHALYHRMNDVQFLRKA